MYETKSSGLGIVLSFFWTGLGQLYAGRIGRGLVMMFAAPVAWLIGWFGGFAALAGGMSGKGNELLGILGFLLFALPIAGWIFGMVDAKALCEAHNRSIRARVEEHDGHTKLLPHAIGR